jgi:hypothetical protein
VTIARNAGWDDTRLGFSFFALGRLTLSRDVERSVQAFQTAATIFERSRAGRHPVGPCGHADGRVLAVGGPRGRGAAPDQPRAARRHRAENAALLATLQMIRAEALDDVGRTAEARAVRLDSMGWGRYGFGSNAAVGARLSEVAALSP